MKKHLIFRESDYRATLQKMDLSSLLPDRSSMFQFDVHCWSIISKTALLLDD